MPSMARLQNQHDNRYENQIHALRDLGSGGLHIPAIQLNLAMASVWLCVPGESLGLTLMKKRSNERLSKTCFPVVSGIDSVFCLITHAQMLSNQA